MTSRAPAPLAIVPVALASVLLLVAGCSSGPAERASSSTTKGTSVRDSGMAFSRCMRDNGVEAFPDPDASGALTIDAIANGTSIDTDSPTFEHAIEACRDLEPSGFTGHTRTPEQQAGALEFAACIRQHGVADFPDPGIDDPMVDTNKIPSTEREGGMDALNAAMRRCADHSAAAGVTGPR